MKRNDARLQETARVLLAELCRTDRELGGAAAPGEKNTALKLKEMRGADGETIEENDILDTVTLLKRYGIRGTDEMSEPFSAKFSAAEAPRTARREFLQQRLERRARRQTEEPAPDGGTDESAAEADAGGLDDAVFIADVRRDELTESGLPERLSEVYRRDARRYDGPFERY